MAHPKTNQWLTEEYNHSLAKFPHAVNVAALNRGLNGTDCFGGTAERYWGRMRLFHEGGAHQQAAQAAGKIASGSRVLWATIRSYDMADATHAFRDAAPILEQGHTVNARAYIDTPEFYETPIGLGMAYLEKWISRTGLEKPLARLGALSRASEILVDSVAVMELMFDKCEAEGLELPKPGLSSGNIEPWITD